MSADALIAFLGQAIYAVVFVVVALRAFRYRTRPAVDTVLFFGAFSLIIVERWLAGLLRFQEPSWLTQVFTVMVLAWPYLLLRLVDDFASVPGYVMRAAEAGLAILALAAFFTPRPVPAGLLVAIVAYIAGFQMYDAVKFVQEARRTAGVTRRRMQAVAAGSLLLGLLIVLAGLQLAVPGLAPIWQVALRLTTLLSALAYFAGFAPPVWLRRAWQEPELRAFLSRAASLPRLPTTEAIVASLEQGAAASIGAPMASIGLWDEEAGAIRFKFGGDTFDVPAGRFISGRAFTLQRAVLSTHPARDDPANAGLYRRHGSVAILAAPITVGVERLGILRVSAPRAPVFADEDLVLVQLLADQAAVILESRALIDEAARVRAREEATRLKDDFLSAAAHDLKTPLTTLVAQAQLLERRARRDPTVPADAAGIERIAREAIRLRDLVMELLDASRAEQGGLVGQREQVDLVEMVREVCGQVPEGRCILEVLPPIVGEYDRARILQLITNLVENALKYSPPGAPVTVRVVERDGEAHVEVQDRGIGIPAADQPHVFDRFYRASNVDDRRFAGMGLGLHICHNIVTQHGGRIWVESEPDAGSTFHVALPLASATVPQVRREAGVTA